MNRTPYAADRSWTRDNQGVHWWIVAVKATFHVTPNGRLTLADEQLPPVLAPEYRGEPGASSLRYDSDLLAVKPTGEILVNARAYAPGGRPATSVLVALRIGELHKELVVHGSRVYRDGVTGLTTTAPRPFTVRPIDYESAFGGYDATDPDPRRHRVDDRNPVGRGVAASSSRLVDQPAHSIEYPRGDAAKVGPAGFGPIDGSWMPRRALAGTYDERWEQLKKPLLPDDYHADFALCSPLDQRPRRPLVGGERVELLNMTPEGVMGFDLPRLALHFQTRFGRRRQDHEGRLATVIVEPEERRGMMVWQTTLRVAAREVDYLDQTEIVEHGGAA